MSGSDKLGKERRAQLEEERDFLMKSLDDLELEKESGGIDDESYAALHDDYTARLAAALRSLRDDVDVVPKDQPAPKGRTRKRVVLIVGVVVFALRRGRARSLTPWARAFPGQTGERELAGDVHHARARPTRPRSRSSRRRSPSSRSRSTRRPTTTTSGSSSHSHTRRTPTS